ncbi:lipoyl protein ligase domain-containing protein [Algirhabdus cladophorae]|uniref:lipoyl protein ligase domain-containing protein n=1 Tax=Algirhabdus cladophorae TaxID=3377108 RepID=UPI003B84821F
MRTVVQTVASAADGLAFEQDLFMSAGPKVGVWRAREHSLVCPRAYVKHAEFESGRQQSHAAGWPVFLRTTGGGTVPQGPGIDNLILAFDAPRGSTIDESYRLLTRVLKRGLSAELDIGETPGSFCDGAWNLSFKGQKLIGTAQRWRPKRGQPARVLAHAVILTTDTFYKGARAVAALHETLKLMPIKSDAHTSLEAAIGVSELPTTALFAAAKEEFAAQFA